MNSPYQTPENNPAIPYPASNVKILRSVAPLKAGLVLGVLYAVMVFLVMLIIVPFGLGGALMKNSGMSGAGAMGAGVGLLIFAPIIYGILGFIGGVIAAWVYNMIAKMTGGFEFTVENKHI